MQIEEIISKDDSFKQETHKQAGRSVSLTIFTILFQIPGVIFYVALIFMQEGTLI